MAHAIKAIETRYRGRRFRSRLEARWAIYFDAVGLAWEYEPEGFDLDGVGRYLPDFWFPGTRSWGEVKAATLTADEMARCAALVAATSWPCVLLVGTPAIQPYGLVSFWGAGEYGSLVRHGPNSPCHCDGSVCRDFPPDVFLCDAKVDAEYVDEGRWFICTGGGADWPHLDDAVSAARGARFEFGESGVPVSSTDRLDQFLRRYGGNEKGES